MPSGATMVPTSLASTPAGTLNAPLPLGMICVSPRKIRTSLALPHKRAVFDALENDGGKERPRIGKDGECGSSRNRTDGAYACDQGDQNEKGTGADGTALKGVLAGFGRPA